MVLPAGVRAAGDLAKDRIEAFPLGERKPALERLGISAEQLGAAGIDPERSGMTIGLDHPTKDGARPAVRVGGIDVRLIGADFSDQPVRTGDERFIKLHGEPQGRVQEGDQIIERYADGAKVVETYDDEGWKKTEYFDENGRKGSSARRIDPEHTPSSDHAKDRGTRPVAEPGTVYVDPDAQGTEVTPEQVDLVLRTLGSAVLTVQHLDGPEIDPKALKRPGTTILVDPEQAGTYGIVLDAPRVTTAQPEFVQDDRSPIHAAPPKTAPCNGLC